MRHWSFYILTLISVIKADKIPELKTSLSFKALKNLEILAIKPIADKYLHDIDIPINKTIKKQVPILGLVDLEVSNVHIDKIEINWNDTNFQPYKNSSNQVTIKADQISANLSLYLVVYLDELKLIDTNVTIDLQNLTQTFLIQFNETTSQTSWGFILNIQDATTLLDKLTIQLEDSNIPEFLIETVLDLITLLLPKISRDLFLNVLGPKIANMSATYNISFVLPLQTPDQYQLTISTTKAPIIIQSVDLNDSYFNIAFNLDFLNTNTSKSSPPLEDNFLDDRFHETKDLEVIIGDNMINQIMWFIADSKVINFVADQTMLSKIKNLPISLTTSGLNIITRKFSDTFGKDKNMYLGITTTNDKANIYFRSGRVVGNATIRLAFIVDTDGSQYPQGLVNCTTCIEAHVTDLSVFFMVSAFNRASDLAASIMEVRVTDMVRVSGDTLLDEKSILLTLNSLATAFIPAINLKANQGIENPAVGIMGIKQIDIQVGESSFNVALEFDSY